MQKIFLIILTILWLTGCSVTTAQHVNQQEALSSHNKWRALHHASPLVWDETLAKYAENHASRCVFRHSYFPRYGENIAAGYPTIRDTVNAWYAEQSQYAYNHPGFKHSTGHFTQVVWKGSRKLGCGYAVCNGLNGTPGKFWVCEYSPHGNITNAGYFERNVLAIKN